MHKIGVHGLARGSEEIRLSPSHTSWNERTTNFASRPTRTYFKQHDSVKDSERSDFGGESKDATGSAQPRMTRQQAAQIHRAAKGERNLTDMDLSNSAGYKGLIDIRLVGHEIYHNGEILYPKVPCDLCVGSKWKTCTGFDYAKCGHCFRQKKACYRKGVLMGATKTNKANDAHKHQDPSSPEPTARTSSPPVSSRSTPSHDSKPPRSALAPKVEPMWGPKPRSKPGQSTTKVGDERKKASPPTADPQVSTLEDDAAPQTDIMDWEEPQDSEKETATGTANSGNKRQLEHDPPNTGPRIGQSKCTPNLSHNSAPGSVAFRCNSASQLRPEAKG